MFVGLKLYTDFKADSVETEDLPDRGLMAVMLTLIIAITGDTPPLLERVPLKCHHF